MVTSRTSYCTGMGKKLVDDDVLSPVGDDRQQTIVVAADVETGQVRTPDRVGGRQRFPHIRDFAPLGLPGDGDPSCHRVPRRRVLSEERFEGRETENVHACIMQAIEGEGNLGTARRTTEEYAAKRPAFRIS